MAKEECLFCRTNKTCRSGSRYELLVTFQTEKLRILSLELEDGYLAVQLVGLNVNQIKAKEFMYHNIFYKIATRPIREQQPEDTQKTRRSLCFEKRIDESVKEVGQAIRKEIQEATPMFSFWPPDPIEIKYERAKIPQLLRLLLTAILQSKNKGKTEKNRKVNFVIRLGLK